MRRFLYIFIFSTACCVLLSTCSFPNKLFLNKCYSLIGNLNVISNTIRNEYPINIGISTLSEVHNDSLKAELKKQHITSITIQYQSDPHTSFIDSRFDSSIVFTWSKKVDSQQINKCLIYKFGNNTNSKILDFKSEPHFKSELPIVRLNDSIWLQKTIYDIVIIID
jgi:hypothetical protein